MLGKSLILRILSSTYNLPFFSKMLCHVCIGVLRDRSNLITNEPGDDGPMTMCAHHRTTQTLEISAAQGCQICHSFWDQVTISERDALRAEESRVLKATDLSRSTSQADEDGRSPEDEEDLFEWLTFTILYRDQSYGGDYVVMLAFSGDGLEWTRVSTRKPVASGLYIMQSLQGKSLPDLSD